MYIILLLEVTCSPQKLRNCSFHRAKISEWLIAKSKSNLNRLNLKIARCHTEVPQDNIPTEIAEIPRKTGSPVKVV